MFLYYLFVIVWLVCLELLFHLVVLLYAELLCVVYICACVL